LKVNWTDATESGCGQMREVPVVKESASAAWLRLALSSIEQGSVRRVSLGGSSAEGVTLPLPDTDLFLEIADGNALLAADHFRATILATCPDLLLSTLTVRTDFGVRVRVASSPVQSCSFFFYEERMLRNVAHRRRGFTIWTDGDPATDRELLLGDNLDARATLEELEDTLLELPSALKYLTREDYYATSIRLTRIIVGLVNFHTADPENYPVGSTKDVDARLGSLTTTAVNPKSILGTPVEPAAAAAGSQVEVVIELLQMIEPAYIPDQVRARYCSYIEESLSRLQAGLRSIAE
jgi:hypothetical protein